MLIIMLNLLPFLKYHTCGIFLKPDRSTKSRANLRPVSYSESSPNISFKSAERYLVLSSEITSSTATSRSSFIVAYTCNKMSIKDVSHVSRASAVQDMELKRKILHTPPKNKPQVPSSSDSTD